MTHTTSRRPRRFLAAAAASVLLLTVSACSGNEDTATSSTSTAATGSSAPASGTDDLDLITDGTLTVGMNLQFEPEMYLDENGEPAGYDVDLLNKLADSLGLTLDIENLDFNGLIPGLQSGKFDMVSVGLTATDERKQVVDFSRAYVPYTSVLAVPPSTTTEATVDAYDTSGTIVTALQGSSGETLAKAKFPDATVSSFADQNAALLEVATGRAAGSVVEDYILAQYTKANPGQLVKAELPEALDVSYGSWAVQKGNSGLVGALDSFLCTEQNGGGLAEAYATNFGVSDFPEMPAGC